MKKPALSPSENKKNKCKTACKASLALAFILCFILSSCNLNKTEHMFLNTGETLSFPARQSARFVQGVNIDGHDFFVFADYRTNKELTIYDREGTLHSKIGFDSLCYMEGRYFKDCYVTDSVILLVTEVKDHVLTLNHNGELKALHYYDNIRDIKDVEFNPTAYLQDSLFYVSADSYDRNMGLKLSDGVIWCDNRNDTNEMWCVIDSFYSRFLKSGDIAVEFTEFLIMDSVIVLTSQYSDSIYLYNMSGNLKDAIRVKSHYFTTKANPVTEDMCAKDHDAINHNLWYNSWIYKIVYDKYRKYYYCFINGPQKAKRISDFSIIVYDTDFNPIFEQLFDGYKYDCICYINEEGLFLKKTDSRNHSFSLFTIK